MNFLYFYLIGALVYFLYAFIFFNHWSKFFDNKEVSVEFLFVLLEDALIWPIKLYEITIGYWISVIMYVIKNYK